MVENQPTEEQIDHFEDFRPVFAQIQHSSTQLQVPKGSAHQLALPKGFEQELINLSSLNVRNSIA